MSLVPTYGGLVQFVAALTIVAAICASPSNTGWHDTLASTRVTRT